MADNYAEVMDQIYECPDSAWFLTANDDAGGGTYQVIEALHDRIDVVVKAPHFLPRFLGELLQRIEAGIKPEEVVPEEITFTERELDAMYAQIRGVSFPEPLRRRLEFFSSQFEFLEQAAHQFEYKTKDTLKLSGLDFEQVMLEETGKDKLKVLGSQTKNGLSVRSLMTALIFCKAMAFFRGARAVELEDIRQILPFVLHDKLVPNHDAPFFEAVGHAPFRIDRVGWIRELFDLSCAEYDRLDLDRNDPLRPLEEAFARGLDGLSERDTRRALAQIEHLIADWAKGRKLYGNVFDDVLKLKYLHQRYTNYLRWLTWKH
jgi:hypothetical protein